MVGPWRDKDLIVDLGKPLRVVWGDHESPDTWTPSQLLHKPRTRIGMAMMGLFGAAIGVAGLLLLAGVLYLAGR